MPNFLKIGIAAVAAMALAWGAFAGGGGGVPPDSVALALTAADTSVRPKSVYAGDRMPLAPDSAAPVAAGASRRQGSARAGAYRPMAADSAALPDPSYIGPADIFRGDAISPSEILRYRSLASLSVPFTLSSSFNRLLPYGNTAPTCYPAHRFAPDPPVAFPHGERLYWAGDMVSAAQMSELTIDPWDGLLYRPYPGAPSAPELALLWENGVFGQNSLNLRLTRALSRSMMLSLFSSYRFFAPGRFSHERGNVIDFYEFFTSDTSAIVNYGYNPLVDERNFGGAVTQTGSDSSKMYAAFAYGNLMNEYALDRPAESPDRLHWARLGRRIYKIDAALLDKKVRSSRAGVRAAFASEGIDSYFDPYMGMGPDTLSGRSYGFAADASVVTPRGFGLTVGNVTKSVEFFDGTERTRTDFYPEVSYGRHRETKNGGSMDFQARLGIITWYENDVVNLGPGRHGLSCEYLTGDSSGLNAYIKFDSPVRLAGVEGQTRWRHLGLLLGYQAAYVSDTNAARRAWLEEAPPYPQPAHTILIAPWTARIGGFSLLSKVFITDTKPHLKTSTNLSYMARPLGMAHTFEAELGFDCWSGRDPVFFAGFYGWDGPIYDLNFKLTAHIREFRLFYKVDNMLNLRQAYVPGYFSPGLTFRWGFNWVINS